MPLTSGGRVWRWVLTGWLVAFTALTFWALTAANTASDQGEQAHDALCVLKDDLERRVAQSQKFLRENPTGIPGISANVLRDSIRNQERTIEALADLTCEPKEEE